jgi:hypothetical protein
MIMGVQGWRLVRESLATRAISGFLHPFGACFRTLTPLKGVPITRFVHSLKGVCSGDLAFADASG